MAESDPVREHQRTELERKVKDIETRSEAGQVLDPQMTAAASGNVELLLRSKMITEDEARTMRRRISVAKQRAEQMRNRREIVHENAHHYYELKNVKEQCGAERDGCSGGTSSSGKAEKSLER